MDVYYPDTKRWERVTHQQAVEGLAFQKTQNDRSTAVERLRLPLPDNPPTTPSARLQFRPSPLSASAPAHGPGGSAGVPLPDDEVESAGIDEVWTAQQRDGDQVETDSEKKNDESDDDLEDEERIFVFSCLNARSLVNKSTALADMFDNTNMSVSIITETWLTNNAICEQRCEDIQYGDDIELLRKDRANRRGGGVAIAYNNKKVKLAHSDVIGARRDHEVVAGIGKDMFTGVQLYVVAVYLPPSMGRKNVEELAGIISDNIARIKTTNPNIKVIMGG